MISIFLKGITSIKKNDIPVEIYKKARYCILDYLACSVAGAKNYSVQEKSYIDSLIKEVGVCSIIGHQPKTTMQSAALINGISAHVLELDDGHRIGMVHLGAPIISAIMAVSEYERIQSKDILYGVIIGYETAIRLSCAIQPGCKLKGFHATGICGTIGAAVGVAATLGFNFDQMKSTMSAAITSAAGVLEMIEGDTQLKPFNAGRAAMDAVSSAYIGKALFNPPMDALGGNRGLFKIMTDKVNMEYIESFNNNFYYINTIYNKPYAACRHCHPSIEAAINLRKSMFPKIKEIKSINVLTYKLAVFGHEHKTIEGVNSAKMSIPYSLAVALLKGKAGLFEYLSENIFDDEVLALTKKINVTESKELTSLCPQKRVAIVIVDTESCQYIERIDYPKGEPENPLSEEEFYQKYIGLMDYAGVNRNIAKKCFYEILDTDFNLYSILDSINNFQC